MPPPPRTAFRTAYERSPRRRLVDAGADQVGYRCTTDFGYFVRTIVEAARARGARQIVWLTYSEEGKSAEDHGAYVKNNIDLRAAAAVPGYSDIQVADWNAYIHRGDNWAWSDGIHLTNRGAYGLADYFSRWFAHLEGRPCTAPWVGGGPIDDPCPNPDAIGIATDIRSVYGV